VKSRRRVGVAFGGGGARGLAHLGALRVLRDSVDYFPQIVAGTSAGSIAAVLYASGLSQMEIEQTAKEFDWFRTVISFSDTVKHMLERRGGGVVSNAKLGDAINRIVSGRTFDDFEIDVAVVAADIEAKRRVIFTSRRVAERIDKKPLFDFLPPPDGNKPGCETVVVSDCEDVGKAVMASCAVPGVFMPVDIAGMRLLDGGAVDQVPVDVVLAMGADFSIGISLALSFMPQRITSAMHSLSGMVALLGVQQLRKSMDMADIGFQVEGIERRSPITPHQYELIDLGEEQMRYWIEDYERRKRGIFSRGKFSVDRLEKLLKISQRNTSLS